MAKIPDSAREYFSSLGRKGAKKVNESMTKAQRTKRARKAARAMWAKRKAGK